MTSFAATFAPSAAGKLLNGSTRSQRASRASVKVFAKGDGTRVDKFQKTDIM